MGFNKRYLPDLKTLKQEYAEAGHDEFFRILDKYDAVIGSNNCYAFIDKARKSNKKTK
jgi:hypothetical protein